MQFVISYLRILKDFNVKLKDLSKVLKFLYLQNGYQNFFQCWIQDFHLKVANTYKQSTPINSKR